MRNHTKLFGALALTAGMLPAASSFAVDQCTAGKVNWDTLIALGSTGCYLQDKLYTDFSKSGATPATFFGEISFYNDGSIDQHLVDVSFSGAPFSTVFTVGYTVSVYLPVNPATFIQSVSLSINPNQGSPSTSMIATGNIGGGPYTGTSPADGNPKVIATSGLPTSLVISQTLTADASNRISSATIQITENVPEPASLALFGLGLAGLGARIRRRKV